MDVLSSCCSYYFSNYVHFLDSGSFIDEYWVWAHVPEVLFYESSYICQHFSRQKFAFKVKVRPCLNSSKWSSQFSTWILFDIVFLLKIVKCSQYLKWNYCTNDKGFPWQYSLVAAFQNPWKNGLLNSYCLNWLTTFQTIYVLYLKNFWLAITGDFIGPLWWLVSLTFKHQFLKWFVYLRNFWLVDKRLEYAF